MEFYHDMITEQSWQVLQKLKKQIDFVLIGGWATYLYTKTLKSKDIDILTDYDQLPKIQQNYLLSKNERLKKYEARQGPVEIDIYLPHLSELGIPVDALMEKKRQHEGFTLIEPDYLLALKLYTLLQRGRTPKGKKDFIDIMALFRLPEISSPPIQRLIEDYHLKGVWENFLEHLEEHHDLPELELNRHQFSKIRKKIAAE